MGAEARKSDFEEDIQVEGQPRVMGGTATPPTNILVDAAFVHDTPSSNIRPGMAFERRVNTDPTPSSADYRLQPSRSTNHDATGCLRKQTSSLSDEYPKPFNNDLLTSIANHQLLEKSDDRQRQVERGLSSGLQTAGSGPIANGEQQRGAGHPLPVDSRTKRSRDNEGEGVENRKRFKSSMDTPDAAQAPVHQVYRNPNRNPTSNIAISYNSIQFPGAPRISAAPLPVNPNIYRQMGTGLGHGSSNSNLSWAPSAPRINNALLGPPPSYEEATLGPIVPRPQPSIEQEIARNRARRYQPPYPFPNSIAELQIHMDAMTGYMERGSAIQHELHLRMLEADRYERSQAASHRY